MARALDPAKKQATRSFRLAVRQAVRAYQRTGRMIDAALAYAAAGFPVFPLHPRTKVPLLPRDPDPTGKFKAGIPQTGGHYKATTDQNQISEMVAAMAVGLDRHADGRALWRLGARCR